MTFYVDSAGRWSGGGKAFLNNAHHAADHHPILQGEPGVDIPIIPRNVPARGARPKGTHVLAPQNAWPWSPVASGLKERALVTALRVATQVSLRRASAMLRISGAIPAQRSLPTSPVIHNVLDSGFDEALRASQSEKSRWPGHLVSIGSGYSYRNLEGLLAGYRAYRSNGGAVPLVIAGPPGSKAAVEDAHQAAIDLPGVTFAWESVPRTQCLAAMREAAAVILPSRVEASPLTVLEACALTPRVVIADILANREMLVDYGSTFRSEPAFADPTSPDALGQAISHAEAGGAGAAWHQALAQADLRADARARWGNRLAAWLEEIEDQFTRGVRSSSNGES